jgi:hypothetical protein
MVVVILLPIASARNHHVPAPQISARPRIVGPRSHHVAVEGQIVGPLHAWVQTSATTDA